MQARQPILAHYVDRRQIQSSKTIGDPLGLRGIIADAERALVPSALGADLGQETQ